MLINEEEGMACCSAGQLKTLGDQVQKAFDIIASCPACWNNFVGMWCRFTCSPDQSTFLKIKEESTAANNRSVVETAVMYVSEPFVQGFYNSCREIKMQSDNSYALDLIAAGAKVGFDLLFTLCYKPFSVYYIHTHTYTHIYIYRMAVKWLTNSERKALIIR
jgi:Niemann-Pick C1 protein